jgi:hypothetical protein
MVAVVAVSMVVVAVSLVVAEDTITEEQTW